MRYLLPLMPFDSIRLVFGYEGLCPPGLGTTRYSAIASAWMDVLPRLLPQKEPLVESAIFSVSVESINGFDLLWRILEIAVPGFKSMNPVQVPLWTPQTDVLSFFREHLLYFRLQSKHNMFFSARTQTNIFLRNIQLSEYADVVTTLLSVPWIPWWHGKRRKEKSEYLAYSIYVSTVTPPHNSLCSDKETCEL